MPGATTKSKSMKKLICICCLGLLIGLSTSAQDDPVDNGPFTPSDPGSTAVDDDPMESNAPDPNDIPVDGGLSLLLVAGAAYGAGRLRRRAQAENGRKN
jgi:hypothetical protein